MSAPSRILPLLLPVCSAALCAAMLVSGLPAQAQSSSAGEEFLSNAEAAPPNILFLIDLSDQMLEDCGELGDSGDTATNTSGTTCLQDTLDAIDQLTQHYDWAYFGVIGTSDGNNRDYFEPIAPIGSSHAEISAALSSVSGSGTDTRNLAESLGEAYDYFGRASTGDSCDSYAQTSLVPGADFCGVPVQWACQETHVITITVDFPNDDRSASNITSGSSLSNDVKCNSGGITTGADRECLYDNAVHYAYNNDLRSDLSDTQNIVTHTVAIKVRGTSVAESLYGNASDQIGNEGIYTVANSGDEILGAITTVMSYIRSGFYSRSAPVVSADGEYIIFSFYEVTGNNPLAEGHIRAYGIDNDPLSVTYGEVQYDGPSQFGGADWDGGDLLVSRPVITSESNPDDRDGLGQRDIYTFVEEMMALSGEAIYNEGLNYHRMGFDYEFVDALANNPTYLDYFLDTTDSDGDGCADDLAFDFTKDGCTVDDEDMQALVDFVRGLPSSTFRYLDQTRGYWKLGDSPHSVPLVVGGRNDRYSIDPSYRNFLEDLEADEVPDVVFVAANDGMLHAFRLYDDPSTTTASTAFGSTEDADEAGEELWAWIPAYTIYRTRGESWSGGLTDMMWYGRTFLFDGSPVWEDVWIDGFVDGTPDGLRATDGSEWRRVVVVQQGKGGPVTLALDITDPEAPQFLWEQTNDTDYSAMGYTTSRPVIANVYNAESSDPSDYTDTYVAMWGGGRAVPYSSSTSAYYATSEANLYMWHIADDYWGSSSIGYTERGSNNHPESTSMSLDTDGDSADEYGYISGALAAVDVDSDGDVDVIYFPVTASYEPTDMSDPDGDGVTGLSDISDPGFTWMYKAIIDTSDVDNPSWCEFYDPYDYVSVRPEVYYAATTSWHMDGSLGVYWGTGTPYDRDSTDAGYLFAVKDETPLLCNTATPIDDCGSYGAYALDAGEGLTGDPIIYAGTLYFSTYVPAADRCSSGEGRIYGLAFEDCSNNMDTDGDGIGDAAYITVDGYPSSVTVSESGTLYFGTSNPDTSGNTAIGEITAVADPYLGTRTLGEREVF
ncbi:MAG: hypothetical protein H6739_16135 [Alphaproteobacteria bacterium]|nr:hypothetical protein [Alphaproteobacteria bacterium]